MKPLIGIASNPFYSSYADKTLSDIEKGQLDYFWLLSVSQRKYALPSDPRRDTDTPYAYRRWI